MARVRVVKGTRVKTVSARDAGILVRLGWAYETRHMEAAPVDTSCPDGPPSRLGQDGVDAFADIDFASDVAYEAARGTLRASDFAGRTGSGKDGAFTTPDVRAIIAARG